jgi:hypothetical protein
MKRIHHLLMLAALMAPVALPLTWTDRSEYDLALEVHAEASPQKQIALLDQWKAKYPKSSMGEAREELYFAAYRAQDDIPHMFAIAHEMVSNNSANMLGLYWAILLAPLAKESGPATLAFVETAAKGVLANREKYFSPQNRPANTPEADWTKESVHSEFVAHRTLGWVAWQRNQLDDAEKELTAALRIDLQDAQISEWLATVLLQQNATEHDAAAAWHLAYAASVKGDGALSESDRIQGLSALDRLYKRQHGDLTGLDQIKANASSAPFPPEGFSLSPLAGSSAADSSVNASVWKAIKQRLAAPDSAAYFAEMLKGKEMPLFKGRLVRCNPPARPKEITLALGDDPTDEVLLLLSEPLPNAAKPGTEIEFTALADSFDANPFHMTFSADPDNLSGWPEAPVRSNAKRAAH